VFLELHGIPFGSFDVFGVSLIDVGGEISCVLVGLCPLILWQVTVENAGLGCPVDSVDAVVGLSGGKPTECLLDIISFLDDQVIVFEAHSPVAGPIGIPGCNWLDPARKRL